MATMFMRELRSQRLIIRPDEMVASRLDCLVGCRQPVQFIFNCLFSIADFLRLDAF